MRPNEKETKTSQKGQTLFFAQPTTRIVHRLISRWTIPCCRLVQTRRLLLRTSRAVTQKGYGTPTPNFFEPRVASAKQGRGKRNGAWQGWLVGSPPPWRQIASARRRAADQERVSPDKREPRHTRESLTTRFIRLRRKSAYVARGAGGWRREETMTTSICISICTPDLNPSIL